MSIALQLRVTHRAAIEVEGAARWWQENRPAAPQAFVDDLKGAFQLLLRVLGVGDGVANTRLAGVRRLHLGRLRYHLYYRVKSGELVVLSVWHTSRGQQPKV